jgi:hypothetical protein
MIPITYSDDTLVEQLAPDAWLMLDGTDNVVLATPERRVTVTDAARWTRALERARAVNAGEPEPR